MRLWVSHPVLFLLFLNAKLIVPLDNINLLPCKLGRIAFVTITFLMQKCMEQVHVGLLEVTGVIIFTKRQYSILMFS